MSNEILSQESFSYEDFQYLRMVLDSFSSFLSNYRLYEPKDEKTRELTAIELSIDKWLQYTEQEIQKLKI